MFEFKKSKTSEKVLTEQEIQQKLYGRFLSNKSTVAGASESYARPASSPKQSSGSSVVIAPENHHAAPSVSQPDFEKAPDLSQEHRVTERPVTHKPSETKEQPRDLFQTPVSERPKVERPNPIKLQKPNEKRSSSYSVPKLPVGKVLAGLGMALGTFLGSVTNAFFYIGKLIDFRREGVRTGLAWGSGVVLLVLLLAAIHGLNSKREVAMKSAVNKSAVKSEVQKKADKLKAVAAESVTAKDAVKTAIKEETPLSAVTDITESETKEPVTAKESISQGRFVIQVATYVIKDDAERLLGDMQKIGLNSFVKTQARSSGKTYYSVLIGRFENFQQAQQELAKFKKMDISRSFKDAFIRTINPQ